MEKYCKSIRNQFFNLQITIATCFVLKYFIFYVQSVVNILLSFFFSEGKSNLGFYGWSLFPLPSVSQLDLDCTSSLFNDAVITQTKRVE
jgi:hypothetical protein